MSYRSVVRHQILYVTQKRYRLFRFQIASNYKKRVPLYNGEQNYVNIILIYKGTRRRVEEMRIKKYGIWL
jgi:predicted transposase YdaD